MISLNVPPEYIENPTEERKKVFEAYKAIISNLHKEVRGEIFTIENGIKRVLWEEPEDEYLERMSKLKEKQYD